VHRFWQAVEDLPGCAESFHDWKDALGDDFGSASFLLRRTGRLASRVACPSPGGSLCPRRVVWHGDGSIVAVCGNHPAECVRLRLTPDDIAVLELDWPKLAGQLCACLGIRLDLRKVEGIRHTRQVGHVDVAAGAAFRVHVTIPTEEEDLSRVAAELVGRTQPTALLVPTRRHLSLATLDVLSQHASDAAVLEEIINLGAPGKFACSTGPRMIFPSAWAATAPAETVGGRVWVLPADARWEQLIFEFEAAEMLRATFRGETRRFEPLDLSMRDHRSKRPTLQWTTLRLLAQTGGSLRSAKPSGATRVKKQKQALAAKLKSAFGIESDPIPWVPEAKEYRARFVVRGEPRLTTLR
jgi:hypothetical protein